jgi:hypothetical protein
VPFLRRQMQGVESNLLIRRGWKIRWLVTRMIESHDLEVARQRRVLGLKCFEFSQ